MSLQPFSEPLVAKPAEKQATGPTVDSKTPLGHGSPYTTNRLNTSLGCMVLAAFQVAGQKVAEDALSNVAREGVLGSIVVLLAVALFFAIRGWLKAKDDRLDAYKEMGQVLKDMNKASIDLAVETNRMVDGVKQSLDGMTRQQQVLTEKVTDLEKEQAIFVATANIKGGKGP